MPWSIVPRPPRRRLPKEPAAHGAKPVRETLPVRSPPVSTRQQIVFGLLAVAGLVLVLFLMRDVIGPFVLGGLLAFVIEPLVGRLTHVGLPRTLAILLVLAAILLVLAGVFAMAVPAGFSLAGVLGMFVAVPVAASGRILYDHFHLRLFGPEEANGPI